MRALAKEGIDLSDRAETDHLGLRDGSTEDLLDDDDRFQDLEGIKIEVPLQIDVVSAFLQERSNRGLGKPLQDPGHNLADEVGIPGFKVVRHRIPRFR